MGAEIQLFVSRYGRDAPSVGAGVAHWCFDDGGAPLRQRELCDRHADWLKANRENVHDLRRASDG